MTSTTLTSTTPISPKVVAATAWAFVAPLLLAAVVALVSYLLTDDGRALFGSLPTWVQVPLFAFVSALSAALGGYRKADVLRDLGQQVLDEGEVPGAAGELDLDDDAPVDADGDGHDDRTGRFV